MPTDVAVGIAPAVDEFRPGGWSARYVGMMIVMILASETCFFAATFPINALPEMAIHYHTSQVVWVSTLFFLIAALVSPLAGATADRIGKKRIIALCLAVGLVGMLLSWWAPSFSLVLIGRALQAVLLVLPFMLPSLARDIFPTRSVALAASIATVGAGIISIPATIYAGNMIENWGWRSVFWFPAIICAVATVLVIAFLPESDVRQRHGRLDVLGALLLGAGIGAILVGVSMGSTWGWHSGRVLALFIGGAALLVVWVFQANHVKNPLVSLHDLASAPILLAMIGCGLAQGLSTWLLVLIPSVSLTPSSLGGFGFTPSQQTHMGALYWVGSWLAGWLVGFGLRNRSAAIMAMVTSGLTVAGFVLLYVGLHSVPAFCVGTALAAIGGSGGLTVAYNLIIRLIRAERQGAMASTYSLVFNTLGSALPVIMTAVMNHKGLKDPKTGTVIYNHSAFAAGTVIPIILAAVSLAFGIALHARLRNRDIPVAPEDLVVAPALDAI